MTEINILAEIVKPLGINMRRFVIDYRDSKNNYFNIETQAIIPYDWSDKDIAINLVNEWKRKGYIVYCIYEAHGNYSKADLETMAISNPQKAIKFVKPIYFDKTKEVANGLRG